MTRQEKGGLLIQVTAWAGLTVYVRFSKVVRIKEEKTIRTLVPQLVLQPLHK
jgi:hypothetical protein